MVAVDVNGALYKWDRMGVAPHGARLSYCGSVVSRGVGKGVARSEAGGGGHVGPNPTLPPDGIGCGPGLFLVCGHGVFPPAGQAGFG